MAKSVRASVSKRNRAKLRATVFGPAVDARTERLSAKLKELASQPIIREQKTSSMELDTTGTGSLLSQSVLSIVILHVRSSTNILFPRQTGSQVKSADSKPSVTDEGGPLSLLSSSLEGRIIAEKSYADAGFPLDMDLDTMSVKHTRKHSQKSGRVQKHKKPRSSIVFHSHSTKTKKGSRRK
jgi:hypothetical protein